MKTLDRCFSIDACISAVRFCSHDSIELPLGATPSASCAKHEVNRGRICVSRTSLILPCGRGALHAATCAPHVDRGIGIGIGMGIEIGIGLKLSYLRAEGHVGELGLGLGSGLASPDPNANAKVGS